MAEKEIESGIWVLMMEQIRVVSDILVQEYLLNLDLNCDAVVIPKISQKLGDR